MIMNSSRDQRQKIANIWAKEAFGSDQACSVKQRGIRFLEEAIETFQATGNTKEMAHQLVDYIFNRNPGNLPKEIGQAGLTLILLAEAAVLSADKLELEELSRVLSKDPEYYSARNKIKNDAGFIVK